MAIDLDKLPSLQLRDANEQAGKSYRAMRDAVMVQGPLDANTAEMILIAYFAALGFKRSFQIHALRALRAGMPKEALQQVVLIPMGAAVPLAGVTQTLTWLDEAVEQHQGSK